MTFCSLGSLASRSSLTAKLKTASPLAMTPSPSLMRSTVADGSPAFTAASSALEKLSASTLRSAIMTLVMALSILIESSMIRLPASTP